ncbi:MAG: hypothetical protein HKP58_06775, partial [Desulfatitalea sp.]|nr:50S ribosomal protein L11 methyltransferase [Desulfatitalea sp.]NNK00100.1 hypothetical protein [Desulfatitalea sp.]
GLLGVDHLLAVDIDENACREASANVNLNGLAHRIEIVKGTHDQIPWQRIDLIIANLRPPTLAGLLPWMADRTSENGFWVLSGFRPTEVASLLHRFESNHEIIWQEQERGWAGLVIHRRRS